MARRAARIAEERKRNASVLVLDAGDSLTGDQEPARSNLGWSSVEAMNRMGYDGMALGAGDLRLGTSVLAQRSAEARFPFLAADLPAVEPHGVGEVEAFASPYVVKEIGGHRIALVGIAGSGTLGGQALADPVDALRSAVARALKEADIVLVLSHGGAELNHRLAEEVPGVAAIFGGGSGAAETAWTSPKTRTPVFHADEASPGHAGRMIGIARLDFDPEGKLQTYEWTRQLLGPEIADNPELADWIGSLANQ